MSANRQSKRPGPDSYDHLWSLLPVFATFFAIIVFAAAIDDRPVHYGYATDFVPLQAFDAQGARGDRSDPSVPPAAEAVARLPELPSEYSPTF
jgi:hypothetical protein